MKPVSKQTLLITLVAILVAINVGLIAFMWYTQRQDGGPAAPSTARFLIKELNFDNAQAEKYLNMQQHLAGNLGPVRQHERQLHDRLFELMHAEAPDTAQVAAMIDSMGKIRVEIEFLTFNHFREVRGLCNAQQKEKFDRIISETMRRMGPKVPNRSGRPGPPEGPPGGGPR